MTEYLDKQCELCEIELWEDLASRKTNYVKVLSKFYCKDCFKEHAPFYNTASKP